LTIGGKLYCKNMNTMKILVLALLAALLLLGAACAPALVAVTVPNLDDVTEVLGYSLAPTQLPEGYEFEKYDVIGGQYDVIGLSEPVVSSYLMPSAMLFYKKYEDYTTHQFRIQYPRDFPPSRSDDLLLETMGIE